MLPIYTEKEHAKCLIQLLEHDNSCNHCVATIDHSGNTMKDIWNGSSFSICSRCIEFVGYSKRKDLSVTSWCPCHQLGAKEAAKRSWIALEEKGYI